MGGASHGEKPVGEKQLALETSAGEKKLDMLAVEEPLEIRLRHWQDGEQVEASISITMRTPGEDTDLALGFLLTEGIISEPRDVIHVEHCGPQVSAGLQNIIRVELRNDLPVGVGSLMRNFYTTSSCGVCGKGSLEALRTQGRHSIAEPTTAVAASVLQAAPDRLRLQQHLFASTGGLHAAGLMSLQGELLSVREDVGRHNALDKLLGHALMQNQLPLHDRMIVLSGRASFELMQKSMMAGCAVVAAVGAPSSLAVECAMEYDITLIGFLSAEHFNIYHRADRVDGNA